VTILRLRPGAVEWRAVEGEILALEVDSSTYIAANASGAVLWERLAKGATREQLVDGLTTAFAIERQQAEADVDTFLDMLRSRNLLEEQPS
jgi:Coenzyme PQQ synthesis protein D (PqqD)